MNYKHVDNGNGQTAITCNEWIADCFIPQGHPNHDIIVSRIMDSLNTIQICDKLPSTLLDENRLMKSALWEIRRLKILFAPPEIVPYEHESESSAMKKALDQIDYILNKIENGK